MAEILFKELSYKVVGAAIEVHKILGPGFLEACLRKSDGIRDDFTRDTL